MDPDIDIEDVSVIVPVLDGRTLDETLALALDPVFITAIVAAELSFSRYDRPRTPAKRRKQRPRDSGIQRGSASRGPGKRQPRIPWVDPRDDQGD